VNDTVMVDWKTDGYSSLFEDSQLSGFLFFQSDSRIHPYKNQSDLSISFRSKIIFEQLLQFSRGWSLETYFLCFVDSYNRLNIKLWSMLVCPLISSA
jgi:hypothetical protein